MNHRSDYRLMAWPWSNQPKRTPEDVAANPRLSPRLHPIGLSCKLGDVIDLSATGARLRCHTQPAFKQGDGLRLMIGNGTTLIEAPARVVWIRKVPKSKTFYDVGITFRDLSAAATEDLVEMARFGFVRPKPAAADAAAKTPAQANSSAQSNQSKSSSSQKSSSGGTTDASAKASGQSGAKTDPKSGRPISASIEIEDYYLVLGITTAASADEVHARFRALARTLHPDRNKSADANEQFSRVNNAYRTLRDPAARAQYDLMLSKARGRAA